MGYAMYHDFTWRDGHVARSGTGCFNLKPPEPVMRRFLLVVGTIIPVSVLAACMSPTAPSNESAQCLAGKVPYAACANGEYVNPWADYTNPWGDDTTKKGG
jgi:hypothetical protein